MDFVALDFETANPSMSSVCQVGIVEFRQGEVRGSFSSLVDPQEYFSEMNIAIHGIDADDVAGALTFPEIYPQIAGRLSGRIVVSHTPFDRGVLRQAIARHQLPEMECRWLDSARVARRTWPTCASVGYGLGSLASMLGIEFGHHNAVEDARAAGVVLVTAIAESGVGLEDWIGKSLAPFGGLNPISREGDPSGALFGESLVFTGALQVLRREAADMAARIGCVVTDSITRKTSILVVGDRDIAEILSAEAKTNKHRKAEALIAAGFPIRIIGETDFMALCGMETE